MQDYLCITLNPAILLQGAYRFFFYKCIKIRKVAFLLKKKNLETTLMSINMGFFFPDIYGLLSARNCSKYSHAMTQLIFVTTEIFSYCLHFDDEVKELMGGH